MDNEQKLNSETTGNMVGKLFEDEVKYDFSRLGIELIQDEIENHVNKSDLTNDLFRVQCKVTSKPVDYKKILNEILNDGSIRVVVYKNTEQMIHGYATKGKYSILLYDDFLKLIEQLHIKSVKAKAFDKLKEELDEQNRLKLELIFRELSK